MGKVCSRKSRLTAAQRPWTKSTSDSHAERIWPSLVNPFGVRFSSVSSASVMKTGVLVSLRAGDSIVEIIQGNQWCLWCYGVFKKTKAGAYWRLAVAGTASSSPVRVPVKTPSEIIP
jgi:hypothetical protein